MKRSRRIAALLMILVLLCLPMQAKAATPIIRETESWPTTCYFHYDGKIAVYTTSKYKKEVKKAVKLLNKKYNVFRYTTSKSSRDVLIRDKKKAPMPTVIAQTWHYNGNIILYKNGMKKLTKKQRILAIAHELGHAAGLNHARSRKSLMYGYVNRMKAKGLSKADVRALKKAKKLADKENKRRKNLLNAFLVFERYGKTIPLSYGAYVLSFPGRSTTYSSSNSKILQVYKTGYIAVKNPGTVRLTVNSTGKKHVFRIHVQ